MVIGQGPIATHQAALSSGPTWSTTIIPVCWENPADDADDGMARTRQAVEGSWESVSAIDFIGWGGCDQDSRGIRIGIADDGPHTEGLGSTLSGMPFGMTLNFTFEEWPCGHPQCIEYIAIHEFGHALGFGHEQNRRDAWFNCQDEHQGTDPQVDLTYWDLDSVMNYCNPEWSGDGTLSDLDIAGVQAVYGPPAPEIVGFSAVNAGTTSELLCSIAIDREAVPIIDLTRDERCRNDEARSLVLVNVRAGRALRLLGDPGGSLSQDWVVIVVLRDVATKTIDTFERSFADDDVVVRYHGGDGLDGKVSRLEIDPPDPLAGVIDLHEGNSGEQDLVCSVLLASLGRGPLDLTARNDCANDEARSLTLHDIPGGTVLRIFGSPTGSTSEDWAEIVTNRFVERRMIGSFERGLSDADVTLTYYARDGLDGKVSRIEMAGTSLRRARVVLYEGNDASQDVVCQLAADRPLTVDFKESDECENDEARSMVLESVPAGFNVELHGSPECDGSEDWARVTARQGVARYVVPTFERDSDDGNVRVDYRTTGTLDGKVSCIRIEP